MIRKSFEPPASGLDIQRLPVRFEKDGRRVITRPFIVGGETRVRSVVDRVMGLPQREVEAVLSQVRDRFAHRHRDIDQVFEQHCCTALAMAKLVQPSCRNRRLLLGSYFTMEYSVASSALFNPSIVPHPDQTNVPAGGKRLIMSLRATGEGHISSIVFRTGVIETGHSVEFDATGPFSRPVTQSPDRRYEKKLYRRKLIDMAIDRRAVDRVMDALNDYFTFSELDRAIDATRTAAPELFPEETTADGMRWLGRENYQIEMPDDADISDVVIFPQSENEARGIEDLRLVPFVEDDGTTTFFGTYTAFNGFQVLPQLMETQDFHRIQMHTLNGRCALGKGMALFPRRIDGHYVMCSRIDGENLYLMYSDIVHFWETAELLHAPKHPWEFTQIGNCGSPLETPEGWLLLTHGVGPVRSYSIGAMLLDLEDPGRVIGHLDQPMIIPTEEEREGYVPNVVYTCGAMIHQDRLYVPYAISDSATTMACVSLPELLARLTRGR